MLKELLQRKAELDEKMASLKQDLNDVMCDIQDVLAIQLTEIRKMQSKEFGAVNITVEGFKVTETIPKKVDWDQDKLGELFMIIMEHGDKPSNYMRMELDVPEKMFESMQPEIKEMFNEARTVKSGKATYKFEEVSQ